jgi:hypothetical protein
MPDSNYHTCQLCNEVYETLHKLGLHIYDKHVPKSTYGHLACPVCGRKYKYNYRYGLGLHWYQYHSGLFKNTSDQGHHPPSSDPGSLDTMKAGFIRYHSEHGYYPTFREFDKCPYLCSKKYIRKYGGISKLRQSLGLDIVDYGKGSHRQSMGKDALKASIQTENEVKEYLIQRYGEICVHEQKLYGSSKTRLDFFVYAEVNFAVDVFSTHTIEDMGTHLNIKLRKYGDFKSRLYFVVMGGDFLQEDIDALVMNKKLPLPSNMQCLTLEEFKRECLHKLPPLRSAANYTKFQQSELPFLASQHCEIEEGREPSLDTLIK